MSNRAAGRMGSLDEYQGDPRYPVATKLKAGRGIGPVRSPIVPSPDSPGPDDSWMLRFFRMWESNGIVKPHEIQSFAAPSAQVNLVAAAAPVLVTSFAMPENQDGFLTDIWINVNPPGNWNATFWSIEVDGSVHPQFNTIAWPALNQWSGFEIQLNRGQTVALFANSTAAPNVSAILRGWGRLIPDGP
jgi:hypothetical protein